MRLRSVALVLASLVTALAASDVINLTASSFDSVVGPEPLILVRFCIPWSGRCKAQARHYEEIATALKEKNIKVAEVDCLEEPDFCQAHEIQGYPTLKVFRYARANDYTGPPDGIISYMVEQSIPAVSNITAANHEEFQQHATTTTNKVVAIAYLTSPTESPAVEFSAVAENHRAHGGYLFGLSTDKDAITAAGVTPPAIVVYRSFDEPKVIYPSLPISSVTTAELEEWISDLSIPIIDRLSAENYYSVYANSLKPLAYLFLDPSSGTETNEAYIEAIWPIAQKYKPKVNFVWIDAIEFGDHAQVLNIKDSKWPAFVIQDSLNKQQLTYPLDQSNEVTPEAVGDWIQQFLDGNLEPALKSAPIPETQDDPVFTLVGKQFDEIVFDDSKDVFLELYTTWCGLCRDLKPTWDSLGEKYAPLKEKITIAKMEMQENELPPSAHFRVTGYPTMKFKPAGTREFIDYYGHRTLKEFVRFVEKHARNSLEIPEVEGGRGGGGRGGEGQIVLGGTGETQ